MYIFFIAVYCDLVTINNSYILAYCNLIKQNFSFKTLSAAVVINLEFLQGQQLLEQHNIGLDYIVGYSE